MKSRFPSIGKIQMIRFGKTLFFLVLTFSVAGLSSTAAQVDDDSLTDSIYEQFKSLELDQLEYLVEPDAIEDLKFTSTGEAPESLEELKAMQAHVQALYEKVEPAVVNINNGMGQGSGVVISRDGYILTAAHVISTPNLMADITFPDGTKAKAQTLGLAVGVDAGILRIIRMEKKKNRRRSREETKQEDDDSQKQKTEEDDADEKDAEEEKDTTRPRRRSDLFKVDPDLPEFPYLDIADSNDLSTGQWVIAIGHPGGINKERGLVLRVGRIGSAKPTVIRTDCTLVGGDSGGPLIDMFGRVVGIHSRIGGELRDNFHVPSNQFVNQWDELKEPVVIDREPLLGLQLEKRTNLVSGFGRSSAARRAGLQLKDRIIRIDDKEVFDYWQFKEAIGTLKPSQEVEFEVLRKGEKKTFVVTVGRKPSSVARGR